MDNMPQDMNNKYGHKNMRTNGAWLSLRHLYTLSPSLRYTAILLLLLVVGAAKMWGQATEITDVAGLNAMTATGSYIITDDIDASGYTANITNFSGTLTAQAKEDGTFPVISGLTKPLFSSINGGTVSNIMLKDVNISAGAHVGAIANTTKGHTVIYNCGILPSSTGSTLTGTDNYSCVGSIVGRITKQSGDDPDNTTRVVNCFSYANVSTTTGTYATAAGIVGYVDKPDGATATTQDNIDTRPMVMNCMFYGEIPDGTIKRPVYGGYVISNNGEQGINNYNYFRESATFDDAYDNISKYNLAWPAKKEYLTRFEYYRSILNSNRQLCTYWITGKTGTEQVAADTALIAKWVLDPGIAPYPILKKWGKYPSIINVNKTKVWNPKTKDWVTRSVANDFEGKEIKTITVNVSGLSHTLTLPVLDMDTLNNDYGYAKIQLPYYNELFGDPTVQLPDPSDDDYSDKWNQRYGGNYKDRVVTGWKITSVSGGTPGKFVGYKVGSAIVPDSIGAKAWEDGFNFADRNCTNKDLYSKSGRVFAQGGYYYVPEGVTGISIEAYWGKAVYLRNTDNSIDRVNVTGKTLSGNDVGTHGDPFTPAGALPATFSGYTVKTSLREAIKALNAGSSLTVYDQAIVLVGNYQKRNRNDNVSYSIDSKWHPFTIMSVDLDLDNEPDYCMQWQFRNQFGRPGIQPIRFDFLPVPDLGLAIRHNALPNSIGIFIPQGHFEITETAFMHLTQFEYDETVSRIESESPLILNGGEIDQIVVRRGNKNRTKYILLGGNLWMNRFTPGYHATPAGSAIRHCAVSVNGGEFPEFYLSGIYAPDYQVNADNPHCYINGGRFGFMAGAGYEQVNGNVTFKIDRAIIEEFYGGGINASKPVTGNIDVTIDNSIVWKYCGGPKVGQMTKTDDARKTVTTHATGTVFYQYFGGGNGGTSFYREKGYDGNDFALPDPTAEAWLSSSLDNKLKSYAKFNPLNTLTNGSNPAAASDDGTDNKGYHALFEFEVFNESNGLGGKPTIRLYTHWAQFGTTITGTISNTLVGCTIKGNFYGGGNLGNVEGSVTSLLKNTEVEGSAYGAGYSAAIPSFKIHDKSSAIFPYVDVAGVMHNGSLSEASTEYTWTNNKPSGVSKNKPYFKDGDDWYCYTWESLENLGAVTGDVTLTIDGTTTVAGSVFGGGEESAVGANTNVNVDAGTVSGNVYGGGKLGSVGTYTVSGSTYTFTEGTGECTVTIAGGTIGAGASSDDSGNVFGAGKGIANTFQCEKGMVYKANVIVSGGTVNGTVYGGGEIGRVENDTEVKIGDGVGGSDTPTPNIHGNVFGAGKGLHTHGYSALVRGNSKVTVEGDSRVLGSIHGGGEISSVGRYTLVDASNQSQYPGLEIGMPGSLANSGSGECTVIVQGHAAIGPNGMQMTASGGPDDAGRIFGAGKGATPEVYTYSDKDNMPKRMMSYTAALFPADKEGITWEYSDDEHNNVWEYFDTEAKYLTFIETMALTTQTEVTVDGNAFVKGSVYGGSENGFVQHNTKVMIKGGQIGAGNGLSDPYDDDKFINPVTTPITSANTLKACATWTYTDDGAPYDKFAGATGYDSKGGAVIATDGHTFYGNVFGGGSGFYPYAPGKWHRKAGSVGGDTRIEISGGHILTNVYGGNEQTDVGTYTHDAADSPIIADGGTCTIVMSGGTIGVPRDATAIEALPTIGHLYGAGKGDKRILFNTWTNVGATSVSVTGGIVYGNVYGGGEDGHVMGNSVTTISETDATNKPTVIGSVGDDGLDGNVFGGGQGSPTALTAGVIGGSVNLGIQGGHILGSVYGGGRIASVGTFFAMATDPRYGMMQDDVDDDEATTDVDESVTHGHLTVNLTGGIIEQNVYGGCMGTNAAAGADDEAIAFAAKLGMSKTVEVNLNKNVADNAKGCVVVNDIFGCNNTNSSPQGSVVVNIYATQNKEKTQIANTAASGDTPAVTDAKRKGVYDVRAVYGGGNLAAYTPLDATSSDADTKAAAHTTVNITGCRTVSIQQVYGGGNAASTPATEVNVEGTFEIYELFGGGNGKDDLPDGSPNPGANVGYYAYPTSYDPPLSSKEERTEKFQYGSGKAAVNILGGTVHRVFGGSNTKGNVRQTAVTMLEEAGGCPFCVDEAYGGGKSAPMDAEAKLLMACIPGLSAAYGGAEAADIQSNVILNITNGTFNRVFGGNNISGTIRGSITVNIEEVGCKPIIIGELYGGGNMAGYSVFGYKQMKDGEGESAPLVWKPRVSLTDNTADGLVDNLTTPYRDPEVNVKSFTSIGTIYGGGYGTTAVMAGSPTVNINVVEGDKKHYTYAEDTSTYLNADNEEVPYFDANGFKELKLTIDGHEVLVPKHDKNKIGAINKVFGGGNAAQVIGSTNVNIGTLEEVYVVKVLSDGADLDNLPGGLVVYTRSGAGTAASPYTYTVATGTADPDETYYEKKTVIGADIRDNVYGGGNNAEVTGATNVTIGREL